MKKSIFVSPHTCVRVKCFPVDFVEFWRARTAADLIIAYPLRMTPAVPDCATRSFNVPL